MLPIQLIPYVQYTAEAVVRTLWAVVGFMEQGRQGYYAAMNASDSESLVTPWLIFCWACMVSKGFRRGHSVLCRFYDFSRIKAGSSETSGSVFAGYFGAISPRKDPEGCREIQSVIDKYSCKTKLFLFGTPSQDRKEKSA